MATLFYVIDITPEVENEPRQVNLVKLQKLTVLCIFQHKAKIGNLGKHRLREQIFSSGEIKCSRYGERSPKVK